MENDTEQAPKPPSMAQAFVMLGSGIVLGFGGCNAFLSSLTSGSGMELGAAGFVLGIILTIAGAIRLARAMR